VYGVLRSHSVGLVIPARQISKRNEQENDRKLEKAALVFYNSLMKKRHSPGLKDVLAFHFQKVSFGKPGYTAPADYAY
jgi:hypothetical protein